MPWLRPMQSVYLVLHRPALQDGKQPIEIGEQDVARLLQLHCQAGIEHVGRRHALMHEAGGRADMLGEIGEEGDHVVLGLALDLVDARRIEAAELPDRRRRLLGDDAERGLGVAGMGLDLEPDAIAVGGLPDGRHLGPAVARDHGRRQLRVIRTCRGACASRRDRARSRPGPFLPRRRWRSSPGSR